MIFCLASLEGKLLLKCLVFAGSQCVVRKSKLAGVLICQTHSKLWLGGENLKQKNGTMNVRIQSK